MTGCALPSLHGRRTALGQYGGGVALAAERQRAARGHRQLPFSPSAGLSFTRSPAPLTVIAVKVSSSRPSLKIRAVTARGPDPVDGDDVDVLDLHVADGGRGVVRLDLQRLRVLARRRRRTARRRRARGRWRRGCRVECCCSRRRQLLGELWRPNCEPVATVRVSRPEAGTSRASSRAFDLARSDYRAPYAARTRPSCARARVHAGRAARGHIGPGRFPVKNANGL